MSIILSYLKFIYHKIIVVNSFFYSLENMLIDVFLYIGKLNDKEKTTN